MTIEITRPEIETPIQERLQSGAFMDAEDLILRALRSFAPETGPVFDWQRAQVFVAVRALAGQRRLTAYDAAYLEMSSACLTFPRGRIPLTH
jgi:hypothetical protein